MHTTVVSVDGEIWYCHHNGDFSGDIRCEQDSSGKNEQIIPFAIMKELVGKSIGETIVERLQERNGAELIEWLID